MDTFVRRAVVALVPPALVGAGCVVVVVAARPRLPENAYGTGLSDDALPWPGVITISVLYSLVFLVTTAVTLHLRRGCPPRSAGRGRGAGSPRR